MSLKPQLILKLNMTKKRNVLKKQIYEKLKLNKLVKKLNRNNNQNLLMMKNMKQKKY